MADYLNIAGRVRTTASDGVAMEAQEVKDLNQNKSQQEINADVQTGLGDRYTKEETYSKEQLDELITTPDVNYVSVVATNATTAVTDILPATGEANTIYRVGNWNGTQYDPTMYELLAWNGSAYVCLAVRSSVGEVYDVSVNHPDGQGNPTPYTDLAAAIGTSGANIPSDIRRGGMSIKFIQGTVQSSDNKYAQFRYMGTSTADADFTNVDNWQEAADAATVQKKLATDYYLKIGNILPDEYVRIDSITGNTGTTRIDTGIHCDDDLEIECTFQDSGWAPYGSFFGAYTNENYNTIRLIYISSNNNKGYVGLNTKASAATEVSGIVPAIKHHVLMNKDKFVIDGVTTALTVTTKGTTQNGTIIINGVSLTANTGTRTITWSDFVIRKNGVVVFDGKPCKRVSDNAIGLYDVVNEQFLMNAIDNSAVFTGGQECDCEQIISVDKVDEEPTAGSENLVKSGGVINSINNSLREEIILVEGTNKYDGNGEDTIINGVRYKSNCIIPIEPNNSIITISCAGTVGWSYIYDTKFILNDSTEVAVSATSHGYNGTTRSGVRYTIPSGAVQFIFRYRVSPPSGQTIDTVRDVMATYGYTIYPIYYNYDIQRILNNPKFTPYTDDVKMPAFVSEDGNDLTGTGSFDNPYKTINKALSTGKDVVIRGGHYRGNINLENSRYNKISISGYANETPIIDVSTILANSASLVQGSTKVYEVSLSSSPNTRWIFQWGIPDESTRIEDEFRTPYHKNRIYRNPYCTSILKANSLDELEQSSAYLFYFDATVSKLYFTCPEAPSATNFIYVGSNDIFLNSSGKELHLKNLIFIGIVRLGFAAQNVLGCVNSVIEDCSVFCSRSAGGFIMDNAQNLTLKNCEAAFTCEGANSNGGDGFNAHGSVKTTFKMIDCYSHDNYNDGYSDHENCIGNIDGGLFEYNSIGGNGCGLTPAYGAKDVIRNVISQKNHRNGVGYFGSESEKCNVQIFNTISRNNILSGFMVSTKAEMFLYNCASYNNSRGISGVSTTPIKCISVKSFSNTAPDVYVEHIDSQTL